MRLQKIERKIRKEAGVEAPAATAAQRRSRKRKAQEEASYILYLTI